MIFDKDVVEKLREFWMECYQSINKQIVKDMAKTKELGRSDARNELILRLQSHLPAHILQQELDLMVKSGQTSKRNRSVIKGEIKEYKKDRKLHPLAEEIDSKIKNFKPLWD